MPSEFSLPSFAKINWHLRVLGKRDDGFHELVTVFQTVSLHDTLHFEEADELELTCDDPNVPTDEQNLIIKAGRFLLEANRINKGARIHLEKRIPSPGGLGGGSSNATVALLGLGHLWQLLMTGGAYRTIARRLGSDVVFFDYGGTALGTGRGEDIELIDERTEENMLIVTPAISVSTKEAFAQINAKALTSTDRNRILSVCRPEARYFNTRRPAINDFEESVFNAHPEIRRVKETLLEIGAVNAAMSGSGASVFAVFDKQETRQTAIKALDFESTWRKFAVATISRDQYREALSIKA